MKRISFADEILRLRSEGYSYNKIHVILKCSKGTISKYSSNDKTKKSNSKAFDKDGIIALNEYLKTHSYKEAQSFFNVSKGTIVNYSFTNKRIERTREEYLIAQKEYKKKKRSELKIKAVAYMGGACKLCGYNRCNRALDFHHIDSDSKDFSISGVNMSFNFEKIKPELDKCILLCRNCHAEVHDGFINL
jgi:transposase